MRTDDVVAKLARIEEAIRASDGQAIRARWEFGREVLAQRQGKKLPPGLLAEICQAAKIGRTELSRRVRFAQAYDESGLSHLWDNPGLTWVAIVNGLPKKRSAPRKPAKPRAAPTAATVKEADRVEELIARPDVAAELLARETESKAGEKARVLAERRDRAAAKRQKEEDQHKQQVQKVLRQQLVQGDKNWENLTEQLEIVTDTVKRYLDLMDGLTVPDQLRLKRLDTQMGHLQQHLLELRGRLWPDYQTPLDLGQTSIINVRSK